MTDNTPEGLPPLADLSEALARGREPRKLWPVLHSTATHRTWKTSGAVCRCSMLCQSCVRTLQR